MTYKPQSTPLTLLHTNDRSHDNPSPREIWNEAFTQENLADVDPCVPRFPVQRFLLTGSTKSTRTEVNTRLLKLIKESYTNTKYQIYQCESIDMTEHSEHSSESFGRLMDSIDVWGGGTNTLSSYGDNSITVIFPDCGGIYVTFMIDCDLDINFRVNYQTGVEKHEVMKFLAPILNEIKSLFSAKEREFQIICYSDGFYTQSYPVKQTEDPDWLDNYNEGFDRVHEHIKNSLETKSNGLVLLHGTPGTGKTSYIRRLIAELNKSVIYCPPDLAEKLSSPEFVTFIMKKKNCIILIEDAENVLMDREAGGSQAVANILNVSDGILGDALQIQFICTFNKELAFIDKALLRPGRLIAQQEFGKLSKKRSKELFLKIHGDLDGFEDRPYTLAEVYTAREERFSTEKASAIPGFL